MKTLKKIKPTYLTFLLTILIVFVLICMITRPAVFISKSLDGISAWAFNVLPSVLPFMFFTRILSSLDIIDKLTRPFSPITQLCFKTPPVSFYTFIMAILSGYPVGAKMVADLYTQGKISKQDAFKMTSFCSTSGPMFIIGAVGIGMFASAKIGYILFISHLAGAILNGFIYRNLKTEDNNLQNLPQTQTKTDLNDIVLNSTISILSVGCIIVVSFIIIECFSPLLNLFPQNVSYLLEGIIEITKGCLDLSTLSNKIIATCLTSFVISFGGISTILQSLTMLNKVNMPVRIFITQKLTHGLLSLITTILILLAFPL